MESITLCFARNLKRYRQRNGWTQAELAARCGLSEAFLQSVECGRRWVGPATVAALARHLDVHESALFASSSDPQDDAFELMHQLSRHLGFEFSDRLLMRCRVEKSDAFAHLPEDIRRALKSTCAHPGWTWDGFRELVSRFHEALPVR